MTKSIKLKSFPKINRIALLTSILCFGAAGYIIFQGRAAETIPHPDGTLVKIKDEPNDPEKENIYQIRSGKLYLFPSVKTKNNSGAIAYSDPILSNYGYTRANAKIPTDKDKLLPKTEGNIKLQYTYKEGTILFDGASYWLIDETPSAAVPKVTRHKIVDPLKYGSALGYNLFTWKYDILRVSAQDLAQVGTVGQDITTYDRHADGTVIKSGNDYYLLLNGLRYKIPNAQIALSHGYNILDLGTWARVKQATSADLKLSNSSSQGQQLVLGYREGTILRCTVDFQPTGAAQKCANGKTYITDDKNSTSVKREFMGSAYGGLGYTDTEAIKIDAGTAPSVPSTDANYPVVFSGTITSNPAVPPQAIISSPTSAASFTILSSVSFNAGSSTVQSGGKIASYSWSFGDGNSGTGATVTHSYAKAGDYVVALKVVDDKGLNSTATVTVKIKAQDVANMTSSTIKYGWNVYDGSAWTVNARNAIRRQKPTMIRWFFDLDRYVRNETKLAFVNGKFQNPPLDFDRVLINNPDFIDFLKALKETNATLVVSNWLKGAQNWYYPEFGACDGCRYPDIAKYSVYMKKVEAAIKAQGVDTIWEPWNEPDLRWGALTGSVLGSGATENFHEKWTPNLMNGYGTFWTAGSGDLWKQMHQITSFPQSSGGIEDNYLADRAIHTVPPNFVGSSKWRQATAPYLSYFSVHLYRNNYDGYAPTAIADYVDNVARDLADWTRLKGSPMKFYIGEIGPSSGESPGYSEEEAKFMRDVSDKLSTDPRTKNYYIGMIAHVVKCYDSQIASSDTRKGWWAPDYSTSDIVSSEPGVYLSNCKY